MIRGARIYSLRALHGDGENLVVAVEHHDPRGVAAGQIRPDRFGETIQAEFVVKTLKTVFPKAVFESLGAAQSAAEVQSWRAAHPGKTRVFLPLNDQAELISPVPGSLNMARIKPAHPGLSGIPHGSLREEVGIPKDRFVVSLYFKDELGNPRRGDRVPSVPRVVGALADAKIPDLVFVTRGGTTGVHFKERLARELPGYRFFRLSEFSRIPFAPGERYVVINDLAGRLPEIYNVSDLAIVSGPINFFEPLTSGAKTIILDNPNILGGYRAAEFKKLLGVARATGGAHPVESLGDLRMKVKGILSASGPSTEPYRTISAGSKKSGAEEYLDHLDEIFRGALAPN